MCTIRPVRHQVVHCHLKDVFVTRESATRHALHPKEPGNLTLDAVSKSLPQVVLDFCLCCSALSFSKSKALPAKAIPMLVIAINVMPPVFGRNLPSCSRRNAPKYLTVPCPTVRLPVPTKMPAASFVRESERCSNVGLMAAKASTFSSATPRAMKPRPVRLQAKKVRSLASKSRAREPVFGRGSVRT